MNNLFIQNFKVAANESVPNVKYQRKKPVQEISKALGLFFLLQVVESVWITQSCAEKKGKKLIIIPLSYPLDS